METAEAEKAGPQQIETLPNASNMAPSNAAAERSAPDAHDEEEGRRRRRRSRRNDTIRQYYEENENRGDYDQLAAIMMEVRGMYSEPTVPPPRTPKLTLGSHDRLGGPTCALCVTTGT